MAFHLPACLSKHGATKFRRGYWPKKNVRLERTSGVQAASLAGSATQPENLPNSGEDAGMDVSLDVAYDVEGAALPEPDHSQGQLLT
jgi:hypothetical protein